MENLTVAFQLNKNFITYLVVINEKKIKEKYMQDTLEWINE